MSTRLDDMVGLAEAGVESDEAIAREINARTHPLQVIDREADFHANLIDEIDDTELGTLGVTLAENVDMDLTSRKEWEQREADGLAALGIGPNDADRDYDSMTDAALPIILQATVGFQARVMREIWPANKPAKIKRVDSELPFAEVDEQRAERAARAEAHFNFQLLHEDVRGYDEDARLTMYTAFRGVGFKEVYFDPARGYVTSQFIPGKRVVVPYGETTLENASRFAVIEELSYASVMRKIESGDLAEDFYQALPPQGDTEKARDLYPDLTEAEDLQQGMEDSGLLTSDLEEDATYTFYKVHVFLDLALRGFKDPVLTEQRGGESRVPAPYVVRVHKETQRIASIHRDWDPEDPTCHRDLRLIKYGLIANPFGFYPLGYAHLLGNLDSASTAILNSIVDGGIRASNQGGFMAAGVGLKGKSIPMTPGHYAPTDIPVEDIAKAFFSPEFKPPAPVLFQVLGLLGQSAQTLGSSTEALTGTAGASGPVGTMLALIEQGMETYAEIFRGFHRSKTAEFRVRSRLNRRFIPEEGHRFAEPGTDPIEVYVEDYMQIGDLVPVSDPQAASPQLRITRAEAILQLAERAPGIHDQYEAYRRMYEALQVEDADEILIDPEDAFSGDPVSENVCLGLGKPVRVEEIQDHQAHLAVHQSFMASAEVAMLPEPQQMAVQMHVAEHTMMAYRAQLSQMLRAQGLPPLPPMDIYQRRGKEVMGDLPPEIENELAGALAALAEQYAEQNPAPPPEDGEGAENEQELAHKEDLHQQDLKHRSESHRLDVQIKLEQAEAKEREELEKARQTAREIMREGVSSGGP